ncbi:hypothetical protein T492DRAFT_977415 [Pavlovales sp. CCMP2436]|nr:hypothetical protein T492DRAFT_977415 [Pavlovales sp. CCMP2436]
MSRHLERASRSSPLRALLVALFAVPAAPIVSNMHASTMHRASDGRVVARDTHMAATLYPRGNAAEAGWLGELRVAASRALLALAVVAIPLVGSPLGAFAENELAVSCGGKFDSQLIDRQCFANSCMPQTQACLENSDCMKGLVCTARCLGDTKCISGCFAKFGNTDMDGLIKCSIEDNSCIKVAILPAGPDSIEEVPPPPLPVLKAFDPKSLDGKWYKVMGWNSMYDCYDCQVNKFSTMTRGAEAEQGQGLPALQVDVDFDMPRPAKLLRSGHNHQHLREKLEFDEPGSKRTAHTHGSMFGLSFWENWFLIGESQRGEPQFKFVYYNGRTIQNKYDGAFVYARTPEVPAEALASIYRIAQDAGLDPSTFCKVKNSCGVQMLGPELIGVEGVLADDMPPGMRAGGAAVAPQLPQNPLVFSSLQIWYELTDYLEDPHYAGSYILQRQERMPPLQFARSALSTELIDVAPAPP